MNGTMPYRGAIYLRLSKDDESRRESSSISSQRRLLMSYAKEHDFSIVKEYSDDGWSGTTFDRPAFQEMIQDVKKGSINLILTKDDCVIIEPTQKDLENQGFVAGSICF